MKKQIGLVLGLAVLSTGALASKARLQALGEDPNGSFMVQDVRNIFYSPAQALYYKDGVTMEWGNTSEISDSTATPRAEGGVLKSHGNMVYGVYLGNETSEGNALRQLAGTGITETNNISFLAAGDAGVQWGAALTYGSFSNEGTYSSTSGLELGGPVDDNDTLTVADGEATLLRSRFSVITGDWEFYARVNLLNKAEGKATADIGSLGTTLVDAGTQSFEGKSGWQVGAITTMNDMKYVLTASGLSGENEAGKEYEYQAMEFQMGRVMQLNDMASLNYRIGAEYRKEEEGNFITSVDTGSAAGAFDGTEATVITLPVVIGLEVQATDWLIIRSSVSQFVWSSYDDGTNKSDLAESTTVNAGVGLAFGDFLVDAALQNDGTNDKGRVSMTYKF